MKITVFGPSGQTGQLVVKKALEAGYEVVAYARNPAELNNNPPQLELRAGALADSAAVANAIQGSGAVISVLGPSSNRPEFAISRATENILAGMEQHVVRRLVVTAGAGIGDAEDSPTLASRLMDGLVKLLARNVYADMLRVAGIVRASDLDWTIVRVPMLTNQPETGKLKVAWVGKGMGPRLSRADLATFLVSQVRDQTFVRRSPALSN